MTPDPAEPPCGRSGCRRDADYRIAAPGAEPVLRCRWHAEGEWRMHGSAAVVTALHPDVPPIDTAPRARATLLPLVLVVGFVVIVAIGFAVIAGVMLS